MCRASWPGSAMPVLSNSLMRPQAEARWEEGDGTRMEALTCEADTDVAGAGDGEALFASSRFLPVLLTRNERRSALFLSARMCCVSYTPGSILILLELLLFPKVKPFDFSEVFTKTRGHEGS
eukprot:6018579-Amphidinium_carterae.1